MIIPFSIYFLVPSAFVIFVVGFYSWFKTRKKENLVFFLLTISQSIWALSTFFMWKSCDSDAGILFWDRVLYTAVGFMVSFFYHFSVESCELKDRLNRALLPISYAISVFFVFLIQTDYFVKDVFRYDWGCHTMAEVGHHFYLVFLLSFLSITLYNFYKTWKNEEESEEKKTKAFYILLAFFIFSLSGLGLVSAYKIIIYPLYYFGLPFCALIITYAITEKNLFPSIIATDILVAVIMILLATFFIFPDLEFNYTIKGLVFVLILVLALLLLKHNHQELQRKQEIERVSQLKSEFISIVSHQLRTPLAAIRGYASMLKDGDYGKIGDRATDAVDYIYESSVRMIKLVNSLLSVSRLEKGKIELNIEPFLIDELIKECIKEIEITAQNKGLYIKYKKPKIELPQISGDFEKIKQAVGNIINNAVLYTIKGGVTITATRTGINFVKIEVKDTGVGIDKDDLQKIFKSFFRGKRGPELHTQGTGLGLYIAKSFIEMHEGSLSVFSAGKNKGSVFTIELPIKSNIEKKQLFNFS